MLERRNRLRRALSTGLLLGLGGGLILATIELLYVAAVFGDAFETLGEQARFSVFDALLVIAAGGAIGVVQGLLAAAIDTGAELLAHQPASPGPRDRWRALLTTVLCAPVAAILAALLLEGQHARRMHDRSLVGIVGGLVGLAGCYVVVRSALAIRRRLKDPEGQGRARVGLGLSVMAAALVMSLAVFVLDARVLARLYPAFHDALSLGAFVAAEVAVGAGYLALSPPRRLAWRIWQPLSLVAIGLFVAIGGAGALEGFGRYQQARAVALAHAPAGGKALGLLARVGLAPTRLLAVRTTPDGDDGGSGLLAPLPPGPQLPQDDVFLITIDALRADHVGAYGYGRPVSPNIDDLAARGVVFDRAYSQIPHTAYSIASILTGKYMAPLMALGDVEGHDSLADIMRRYGIKTGAFFPPSVFYIDEARFDTYAQSYYGFEYVKMEFGTPPDEEARYRTDQIITYLDTVKPAHAFVWIHYLEPHEPYITHPGIDFGPRAIDRYDGEIAYADHELGRLMAYLAQHRPNAIIIVTADHGEEFGDHGGNYHGSSLYDEQIHVPLIVSSATGTVFAPHHVGGQVETVDIARTILGLLGIPASVRMRGVDLGPWLNDPPPPTTSLPAAFASIADL
jgi:hypothetical protein